MQSTFGGPQIFGLCAVAPANAEQAEARVDHAHKLFINLVVNYVLLREL